ncbi:MAG: IS30 family transposase [Lachnospiraceae bacterium]|nr:IS30 family transposase [Lachnospiraceae bacterium]
MDTKYTKLTHDDRRTIERMYNLKKRFRISEIAAAIGKHRSTVYREIERGKYQHKHSVNDWSSKTETRYSADKGHAQALAKRKRDGRPLKIFLAKDKGEWFISMVREKIKKDKHSPAAALAFIARQGRDIITVSIKTLYRYIYKGIIGIKESCLPHGRYSNKKYTDVDRKKSIPYPGKSIEKRPPEVLKREEFGHWEMDTVMGKLGISKHSLLVLTERKTRFELIMLLSSHTSDSVVKEMNKLENALGSGFHSIFKSITLDNGTEFADAEGIMKSCIDSSYRLINLYYCHPRSPGERGSNENCNRLIRRHIPKGTDFDGKKPEDINTIQNWINEYARKLHNYETASDRLKKELAPLRFSNMKNVLAVFT